MAMNVCDKANQKGEYTTDEVDKKEWVRICHTKGESDRCHAELAAVIPSAARETPAVHFAGSV